MNKKIDIKNKYLIGGVCFILIAIAAVMFVFSKSYALESFGKYNLSCDKDIAIGGEFFNCTITGTVVSESQVSALETQLELSDNLEFVSFTTDEIWQGSGEDGNIQLYTDENKTETFNVGTLIVKVKDGITNTTESIKLKDSYFYDGNFESQTIEETSIEVKTPQYSSEVYDLSKEYIISNTKDIATIINNVSTEGCVVGVSNNDSNVSSGFIVDGAKLTVIRDDKVLKEFSVVYINSDVYDLSNGYIISSVDTLTDIIDDVDTINGSLSIKNNQLVLSYNSTGVVSYDIVNIYSDLYKINLDNSYIFMNGEISENILNNISKSDNIILSINDGNLDIIYKDSVVKSLKILNIYTTKYDIDLDNEFIYTKSDIDFSDITSNVLGNATLSVNNNKLNIKYNNVSIMNLDVVSINSTKYKINYDKEYIYTGIDNNVEVITENISITNSEVGINNKLQLKYNSEIVEEFTLYYINSSLYKIVDNTIYIKGAIDYNTFIGNISFNGLDYNIYNISNEAINDGNVDDNYSIKILKDDVELDTYMIKTEYLEINNLSVEEDSKIIYNVSLGTTYATLMSNIETSGTIEIYDKSGKSLNETSVVKSASVIKIKLSSDTIEYKLSVLGDLNGSGTIDAGDVAKLYQNVKKINTFDRVDMLAGDVKKDGEILVNDVSMLYKHLKDNSFSLN